MKRNTKDDNEETGSHLVCSREWSGSRMDALLAKLRSEVSLMRIQGTNLTKQVQILYTAVDDFVKTVTKEIADSCSLSADGVGGIEVSQRAIQPARAGSGCENDTGAAVDEAGFVGQTNTANSAGLSAEDANKSDTDCPAVSTDAAEALDPEAADTCDCHRSARQPAGHNLVTKANDRTAANAIVVSSSIAKQTPLCPAKRSHGDRHRRSREQSRDVDIRRDHDNYADRLICKVARMTRVDVTELWSSRPHDEKARHHRRDDTDKCVTNSSPVTTSSGYESDVDCIREEEIDKLLHGDCSKVDCREKSANRCRERSANQPTIDCQEPFVLLPDDKYEANYAINTGMHTRTTGRHGAVDFHRNVQDMTSPRGYHDHTRKLSRVARSMEQIIRDLEAPKRVTKRNAKPVTTSQEDMMQHPINRSDCGVDVQRCAKTEDASVDLEYSSAEDCVTSDMLAKPAVKLPAILDDEGRSAFRPYKSCSNTSDSTEIFNAEKALLSLERPGCVNDTNPECRAQETTHTSLKSTLSSTRLVYNSSTLQTHRSASPDSGRGSWSNYGTSPDYADRKRQPSGVCWPALRGLSEVDAFVESEPIYETIDDGAVLPRGQMSEYASPPPLPQRPVRCMRRLSTAESKYATLGDCASSGWGHTPPRLPPRDYQHGRSCHCKPTNTSATSATDFACRNNAQDVCETRRTVSKTTTAGCNDGVAMRRQQPEVRHIEDIVKSSDIVDLSGAHIYTVADVLESIHGYVGHLSSGGSHSDKPADECTLTRSCPVLPSDSVGRDTDYHLLTKAAKSQTSIGVRPSSNNAQCLCNAQSTNVQQGGCFHSTALRSLQDDSADWRRTRGCDSRDLEMRTSCAELRRHNSDLVWSSNRSLQGTYC